MRKARFATVAAWLLAFGLGGVALAEAITSPVSEAVDPSFDIRSAEVRADGDLLRFRITVQGNAGASVPPRTGALPGSQMFAYIWPTNLNSAVAGFPGGQGTLALALVNHPDLAPDQAAGAAGAGAAGAGAAGAGAAGQWHPHWMVLVPAKGCGPFGLRVLEGPPPAPGALPLRFIPAAFSAALTGPAAEVSVPARLLGDASRLRFDGLTATLVITGVDPVTVMCVRPFDVASGRLTLQGSVTGAGE
ncbi:MAG TPA: hypothetical protein VKZ46_07325 [Pedomonas sp.]|nr:hypothetical protein [Pedomonas sp.]